MRARMDWLGRVVIGIGTLAVTSRRWSASLLASALGMGLFIGVAFGPATDRVGAAGSQVLAIEAGEPPPVEPASTAAAPASNAPAGGGDGSAPAATAPTTTPSTPLSSEPAPATPAEDPPAEETPTDSDDDGGGGGGGGGGDPDPDPDTDPEEVTLSGTVVHVNPLAESYALAVRGELYGIHSSVLPEAGDQLEVPIRELANGTYADDGVRVATGTTESGTLNGFVTYVSEDPQQLAYTVSARGVSVPIRLPGDGSSSELPKLGAFVSVDADINEPPAASRAQRRAARSRDAIGAIAAAAVAAVTADDPPAATPTTPPAVTGECVREEPGKLVKPREELVQQRIEPTGDEFTYFDLAGTVQAVCPGTGTGTLLVSADGIRKSGTDLTLTAPKEFNLAALEIDEPVLATAELADDGSLTLAGIASDEGLDGADDVKQLQGDFAGN